MISRETPSKLPVAVVQASSRQRKRDPVGGDVIASGNQPRVVERLVIEDRAGGYALPRPDPIMAQGLSGHAHIKPPSPLPDGLRS